MLEQKLEKKKKLPPLHSEIIAIVSWGLIMGLFGDFIIGVKNDPYGFGHWSINPLYDLIYLRIGGPLLYGNHVSVGLFLLAIPIYFALIKERNYLKAPIWLSMAFATVFLHELILQIYAVGLYGWAAIEPQLFSYYMLVLFVFFALALIFGSKLQRRKLICVSGITVLISSVTMYAYSALNYRPFTLEQFTPGPQIYSLIPNLVEIALWFIPISFWFWGRPK
jgi:hypothetical protein